MSLNPVRSITPVIDVYVKLAQYPVLSDRIRLRMREEMFRRGVISKTNFEQEVKTLAIESQQREGLSHPQYQEDENVWQQRIELIRDYHTDACFANNLGISLLNQLIEEVLNDQPTDLTQADLSFNPEIAPWALLFQHGELYDTLPPPEKEKVKHHLEEIKVVLIKRLMSEALPFIAVAKNIFTVEDLRWVYERLIGRGKIGGKASGMLLAWKILTQNNPQVGSSLSDAITIPETYFIGSEMIYEFIYLNKLERFVNQKYLPDSERQLQYPDIISASLAAQLPSFLVEQLREVLDVINGRPLIVRSSSLLEDHLDYSFAGKYASIFCPNQGSPEENLTDLLNAVRRIYASTFNPNAMRERESYGLIDYDERMAIMIQPLVGEQHGRYFFPTIVGIGLSENPFYQETGTRKEDGCLRLVWGFGNRITQTEFQQQSCVIALSHPRQRPYTDDEAAQEGQQSIKVVDLQTNQFENIAVNQILSDDYAHTAEVATAVGHPTLSNQHAVTFDTLTQDRNFVRLMRQALLRLQTVYEKPVELEFTLMLDNPTSGSPYKLYILQCHTR